VKLTKMFTDEQYAGALESWAWLDLSGKTPGFTSLFGDVFLSATDGWWYLDTIEGKLSLEWPTEGAMLADLGSDRGEDRYLLSALAEAAHARGLLLGENDVYDFMPPPILGGSFAVDNIQIYDFEVAVNIAGQLHEKVRLLPPGTPITGFTIGD
jgi:T6SS immunity protein Tdi1, C-terminal